MKNDDARQLDHKTLEELGFYSVIRKSSKLPVKTYLPILND